MGEERDEGIGPLAIDLSSPRHLHLVGAGGAGMSAIAIVLLGMGHRVSGSDQRSSRPLDRVALAGGTTRIGHAPDHVPPDADALVVSTAVRPDNPEVVEARRRGLPVLTRAAALAAITAQRPTIAVAGSHGKTTTSSMLTVVLRAAGWEPSFIVGGDLNEVGTNAAWSDGRWLVVEADESDGTFLEIPVAAAVVTNVEADHLDRYGDVTTLAAAFERFAAAVPGPLVTGADDPVAAGLARDHPSRTTFGFSSGADYRIEGYEGDGIGSRFTLVAGTTAVGELALPVAGRHHALDAAAAGAIALEIGVPFDAIATGLASFGGVARRFEVRGRRDGVTFVDDYAHLPTEVAAAVAAAREGPWSRVIVVFQPHRYTRTASLGRSFADAFTGADEVFVTDVYPAGEDPIPGVTGRVVADAVAGAGTRVTYLPARADLRGLPGRVARPGDLVLTLGAGDLTTLPDEWLTEPERT